MFKLFLFGSPRLERERAGVKIPRRKTLALLAYLVHLVRFLADLLLLTGATEEAEHLPDAVVRIQQEIGTPMLSWPSRCTGPRAADRLAPGVVPPDRVCCQATA